MISAWTSSPGVQAPLWFSSSREQAERCGTHRGRGSPVLRHACLHVERMAEMTMAEMLVLDAAKIEKLKVEGCDGAAARGCCPWGVESDIYVVFCPIQIEWE